MFNEVNESDLTQNEKQYLHSLLKDNLNAISTNIKLQLKEIKKWNHDLWAISNYQTSQLDSAYRINFILLFIFARQPTSSFLQLPAVLARGTWPFKFRSSLAFLRPTVLLCENIRFYPSVIFCGISSTFELLGAQLFLRIFLRRLVSRVDTFVKLSYSWVHISLIRGTTWNC